MKRQRKLCIGSIQLPNEKEVSSIFTTDFLSFYWRDRVEVDNHYMHLYAVALNSPWNHSCTDCEVRFSIKHFCFVTTYSVIGQDFMETEIYGYGITKKASYENCKKNYRFMQEKFNPKNKRI